ncbi:patatin-like phospholipase family protein [Desulfobacterium sp. N47]
MNVGLALGSGSSRGWAHIGIIRALSDIGIEPGIICGTSIGALVGASHVSDKLEKLEEWVGSLTRFKIARFFEINTRLNGFVKKERFQDFLKEYVANDDAIIENLAKQYASVATDLESGREMWLTKGSLIEAVWSSVSLPGLFPAIRNNGKWLVDGGLVNPVPVSVCRALGADIVIAVNLNGDIVGKHFDKPEDTIKKENGVVSKITDWVIDNTGSVFSTNRIKDQPPSLFESIAGSVNIIQDRITRNRIAGDPPDILLSPKLSHIGLLEFYRGKEAIREGNDCVRRMLSEIKHAIDAA